MKPGVKVVTPNPFTSGAAKWNLLGAYAHGGLDYVEKLIKDNVSVQPKSGREALQTFTGGEGDVLLSYEYEATTAIKKGEKDLELVRPADRRSRSRTRSRQTKDAHRRPRRRSSTSCIGPEGQQIFADWGYRPVNPEVARGDEGQVPRTRPRSRRSTTSAAGRRSTTSCSIPRTGSIAKIEEDAGVSTAK